MEQHTPQRRCLLVDGHGLLYRAFFALPVMTTRDGRHTHALFGFIRMLTQLQQCWQPTHAAVVFDAGLPDHRMSLLPDYKAQRPSMPPALREQIAYVNDYLETLGIPVVTVDGQEADDVAATLVDRLLAPDITGGNDEILIASSDKDLYQLVNDHVVLVPPAGQPTRIDTGGVLTKTGVPPPRLVEWLALIGDTADNIPGVPGIGPKTAARLLQEYPSLDAIWQDLDAIRPANIRAALQSHRPTAERNIALMTLHRDLPIELTLWQDLALAAIDPAAEQAVYQRYEMKPPRDSRQHASASSPDKPTEQQGLLTF